MCYLHVRIAPKRIKNVLHRNNSLKMTANLQATCGRFVFDAPFFLPSRGVCSERNKIYVRLYILYCLFLSLKRAHS